MRLTYRRVWGILLKGDNMSALGIFGVIIALYFINEIIEVAFGLLSIVAIGIVALVRLLVYLMPVIISALLVMWIVLSY